MTYEKSSNCDKKWDLRIQIAKQTFRKGISIYLFTGASAGATKENLTPRVHNNKVVDKQQIAGGGLDQWGDLRRACIKYLTAAVKTTTLMA